MFTNTDRIKELAEFLVKNSETEVFLAPMHDKNNEIVREGVAVATEFQYHFGEFLVHYSKWIVENYKDASTMRLQGCEKHNSLIRGSGVEVFSKKLGSRAFYGAQAFDIIDVCEKAHFDKIQKMTNNFQR